MSLIHNVSQVYALCRPKNAVPPLLSLLIGYILFSENIDSRIFIAATSLILLNFFATLQNDIADKNIDIDAGRKNIFLSGSVSPNQLKNIAYGLALLAFAFPLILTDRHFVLLLLIYSCLIVAYNLPPLQLSRRPFSSIILLALVFSTLPLLLGFYIASGHINSQLVTLTIGSFLIRFSISMLKDFEDYGADKKHNKNTFLVAFGPFAVKTISILFSFIGYTLMLAVLINITGVLSGPVLLFALLAALAFYSLILRFKLEISVNKFKINHSMFHQIIDIQNGFEIGVLLFLFWF